MATPEDAGTVSVSTSAAYCPECGQENSSRRGACVICFAPLRQTGHGQTCSACGEDNPKDGRFCQRCGTPFSAGVTKPQSLTEVAYAVLHGGVAALTADSSQGFYEEEDSGFLGGQGDSAAAVEAPPPAPAPAPPVYEEEEEMAMPPSALALEQEATVAPPPPPAPDTSYQEDFAPPPPPPGLDDEDSFAPPPPPPGLVDDEEAVAPPPAAPPAAAPAAAPAADGHTDSEGLVDPLALAAAEAEDEDFGDWSLEVNKDESSS